MLPSTLLGGSHPVKLGNHSLNFPGNHGEMQCDRSNPKAPECKAVLQLLEASFWSSRDPCLFFKLGSVFGGGNMKNKF